MFNKKKKIKLCGNEDHDWFEIGRCKDALGEHPCKYAPDGCDTCMTKFQCYTRDNNTYRDRLTGIFYACKKCPAVKVDGEITEWITSPINGITDIRKTDLHGLDKKITQRLRDIWKDK